MASVLAFDFGLKRTGVAIGNTITQHASPETTLYAVNNKPDWDAIDALINLWKPAQLVVGMPYSLDEQDNPIIKQVTRFCNQLKTRYNLPVDTENEQFSSLEAQERLKKQRQSGRKQKVKKDEIDQHAAAIILESWFLNAE